jgi:chromosome segregation ATPase
VFLRSIRLRGFKSFPDPVEVRLERGVAVVVGPNGSGKSNISDAIVWAAGSLSPSELRAEKPEDVLFSGSATRAPADFCSVELVFDNEDGEGPLPYSELSVTRRLTRGGDGQYLVNGANVRRTDLVELLADMGLGQGLHSVIGQGSVEQILASKPAERRALVEEAAGLGGYKRRRHRAELKLARVADQVERACDLEAEVRKRLRPLALQATAAVRAEKLGVEIERLKSRIASAELERLEREIGEIEERRAAAAQERRSQDELLSGLLEERRRAEDELGEAAGRHEQATSALYRLRSALERVELRRERAEETTQALCAERDRPRRVTASLPPAYERTVAGARTWPVVGISELPRALDLLAEAHVERRDALVATSQGTLWFAAEAAKLVETEPAPPPAPPLDLLVAAAERVARELASAAKSAARFEPALRARVDIGGSRSRELGDELRALGAREVEARRGAGLAAERLSAVAIEAARVERERDEVLARLTDGAGAEPLDDAELADLRASVARLERRRESLGQVNPFAAEEHARESERLAELVVQREDLERSLRELETLRRELTETVETRFTETYAAVERHFAEVSAALFPGGKGRLVASEDEDGELGVEIELQPAGKRVTRLSLLSGGEKALGAISFLFALFLARPCPFYLLDEVEAALDDTNIGRFVELLRGYAERAQFVVVTHQKRTMEAADILYGVTMGGDGVSQVVSKRLAHERDREHALSA